MITSFVGSFDRTLAVYEMARADAEQDVESDEEIMLLGTAHNEATCALLLTAAPDWPALVYKMEAFAAEDCFGLESRGLLFSYLVDDVRRLARV